MKLLRLLGLLAAAALLLLLSNTVVAFTKGTGSVGPSGPTETLVEVRVESCERVGPLHDWRLGFWWVCQVQVRDGGRFEVDRSIVSEGDVGRTVYLYQACFGPPNVHCSLGKEMLAIVEFGVAALGLFRRLAVIVVAGWAFTYLLAAVVGARRFVGFIAWWGRLR